MSRSNSPRRYHHDHLNCRKEIM